MLLKLAQPIITSSNFQIFSASHREISTLAYYRIVILVVSVVELLFFLFPNHHLLAFIFFGDSQVIADVDAKALVIGISAARGIS
jgi:hypothetical protein